MLPRGLLFLGLLAVPAVGADVDVVADCGPRLVQLYVAGGRVKKHEAVGFHGTSVEALAEARKAGLLLGSILPENAGGVYFYPNVAHPAVLDLFERKRVKRQEGLVPEDHHDPVKDAWDGAEGYARTIAREHRMMKLLELPFTPDVQRAVAAYIADPTDRDHADRVVALGAKRAALRGAYEKAMKAKGVVLFVGPLALEKMKVVNARPGEDGLRIETGNGGLPVDCLLAIEPMDDDAYEWLAALRREGLR